MGPFPDVCMLSHLLFSQSPTEEIYGGHIAMPQVTPNPHPHSLPHGMEWDGINCLDSRHLCLLVGHTILWTPHMTSGPGQFSKTQKVKGPISFQGHLPFTGGSAMPTLGAILDFIKCHIKRRPDIVCKWLKTTSYND